MIKGLHHNAYRCRDSEETRKFYEDFLGTPLAGTLSLLLRPDLVVCVNRVLKIMAVEAGEPGGGHHLTSDRFRKAKGNPLTFEAAAIESSDREIPSFRSRGPTEKR